MIKPEVLSVRIPAVPNFGARESEFGIGTELERDQLIRNGYIQTIKNTITNTQTAYTKKRPGYTTFLGQSTIGEGRGIFTSAFNSITLFAIANKVYKSDGSEVVTISTGTDPVGFCDCVSQGANKIFICDGISAWLYDIAGGTITQITDTDLPNPHLPYPVFMDGYLFLASSTSSKIYNSDLQNLTSWNATNYLSPESYVDKLVGLTRQNNYVVAIGSNSTEFFYNAGNSLGSPLRRNENTLLRRGTDYMESVATGEGIIIMASTTETGGLSFMLLDSLAAKDITNSNINAYISEMIQNSLQSVVVNGSLIRVGGKLMYVVSIREKRIFGPPYYTPYHFVYDIIENMWYEWTNIDIAYTTSRNGDILFQGRTAGEVSVLNSKNYTDNNNSIPVQITLPEFEGENTRRKFWSKSTIVGNDTRVTSIDEDSLLLGWSDDDGINWKYTQPLNPKKRKSWYNLGSSRRRSYRIIHNGKTDFRMSALEIEYIQGEA